jgi:transcriptional regulator
VLIKPHDRPVSDEETRAFLDAHDFGELIAPGGPTRDLPVVAPTHWAFADDERRVAVAHFARANPIWDALREKPRAMLSVIGDFVYVRSDWNAGEEAPSAAQAAERTNRSSSGPEWGVPTSYYGAVQMEGDARIVEDAEGTARILRALFARLQPEGGHEPVEPGDNPYAKQFGAIAGVELRVTSVRAKFKYGGNRPAAHRARVAERLAERGGPGDAEAREHLRRRP